MVYVWIGCVIILFLGAAMGIWKLGVKSQTPKRVTTTKVPDLVYEDVVINSGNSVLKGWFIPAPEQKEERSPLVILVHGWGSSKSRMLRYAGPLSQAGYSLLLFDIRGHGESDEVKALTIKTFRDDILSAVQYAQTRADIDPRRIAILGHSFGAMGSIIANKKQLGIKAVVTDSMPARIRTVMEVNLRQYKLPYFPLGPILSKLMFIRGELSSKELIDFNVLEALNQRKSPVLLIHSKHDDYVPFGELTYLVENIKPVEGAEAEYLYVESKGHRSSETDPLFWKQVLHFLKRHV